MLEIVVICKKNEGLERYFDLDEEYLADSFIGEFITVEDRFGEKKEVLRTRFIVALEKEDKNNLDDDWDETCNKEDRARADTDRWIQANKDGEGWVRFYESEYNYYDDSNGVYEKCRCCGGNKYGPWETQSNEFFKRSMCRLCRRCELEMDRANNSVQKTTPECFEKLKNFGIEDLLL